MKPIDTCDCRRGFTRRMLGAFAAAPFIGVALTRSARSQEHAAGGDLSTKSHLEKAKTEQEFVQLRDALDADLPMPKLILHALQVNILGGRLPGPESNGTRYVKIPLNALECAHRGE